MLTLKLHPDQVIRITVCGVAIRLRMVDTHKNRIAIEAPATVPIERFRVSTDTAYTSLEALERATGHKIGGPNEDPHIREGVSP